MLDLFQLFALACAILYVAIAVAEGILIYHDPFDRNTAWWLRLPKAIAGGLLLPGTMLVKAVVVKWAAAIRALFNLRGF